MAIHQKILFLKTSLLPLVDLVWHDETQQFLQSKVDESGSEWITQAVKQ